MLRPDGASHREEKKEPETHPVHTARESTSRPNYTTVTQASPMRAPETLKAKNVTI